MPEYIIWDWNGTLMDDSLQSLQAMNKVLEKYGLERLSRQRYMDIFTFPVLEYYKLAGFDLSAVRFEELSTAYVDEYSKLSLQCSLTAGALEVLSYLSSKGIEQILLSASETEALLRQTEALSVRTYFSHIIGADNIHAFGKIQLALDFFKLNDLSGEKGILIGDTIHDYETARGIGCGCILYFSGHQSVDRLKKCGAPIIKDLREIKKLL